MMMIDNRPGLRSDEAFNWIRAMEDVKQYVLHMNPLKSLEQAKTFAMICDLSQLLTGEIMEKDAARHIRDALSEELTASLYQIHMFERALQIENCCTANVLRQFDKWKSKLEVPWPTEIT